MNLAISLALWILPSHRKGAYKVEFIGMREELLKERAAFTQYVSFVYNIILAAIRIRIYYFVNSVRSFDDLNPKQKYYISLIRGLLWVAIVAGILFFLSFFLEDSYPDTTPNKPAPAPVNESNDIYAEPDPFDWFWFPSPTDGAAGGEMDPPQ